MTSDGKNPDGMNPEEMVRALLPPRVKRSNKGSYGKVLLMAGSRGMAGAALFAGEAAYRCGCGLAAVAGPEENRVIVQLGLPEALYVQEDQITSKTGWCDVFAAGPGIGCTDRSYETLKNALEHTKAPIVLDADALNLLSQREQLWQDLAGKSVIITPHPGEMSRLTGMTVKDILADTARCAKRFAKDHGCVCVLKDERTVVTDGSRTYVNFSGCDGMASGGSGDVLTGMTAGFLAQDPKMDPFSCAVLSVYLHGRAGEAAQRKYGARSMLARDTIAGIPEVLRAYS